MLSVFRNSVTFCTGLFRYFQQGGGLYRPRIYLNNIRMMGTDRIEMQKEIVIEIILYGMQRDAERDHY